MRLITPLSAACLAAFAQGLTREDAESVCQDEVARRMSVSTSAPRAQFKRDSGGSYWVDWRVDNQGRTMRGSCEVDRESGRVVRFQDGSELGSAMGNYRQVSIDTSGSGAFSSRSSNSIGINRAFVDTRSRPSIALAGRNFRMTFYGEIERLDDHNFTMRISGSDRGDARGRADFRLNRGNDEVEMINLSGRMSGETFHGSFNRK